MGAGSIRRPTPVPGSVAAELALRALRAVEDDLSRHIEVLVEAAAARKGSE